MARSRSTILSASLSSVLLVLALASFFGLVQSARAGSAIPQQATTGAPFLYAANSGIPPDAAGGGNSTAAAPKGVAAFSSIWAYSIDLSTGALTPVAGSPYLTGLDTNSIVIDPAGRFLYASNEDDDTISAYTINKTTGFLTPIIGAPFPVPDTAPNGLQVHPNGNFLYMASSDNGEVWVFAINQTTGALTPIAGSPFAAGSDSDWVAIAPSGKFAYVTNDSDGTVSGYTINQGTGALTPVAGSPFSAGNNPDSAVVSADSKYLYVANWGDGSISAYSINQTTGVLTALSGSPYDSLGQPDHILLDKSGKFIYTANDRCGEFVKKPKTPKQCTIGVGAFSINAGTGALTPVAGSPFIAGEEPSGTMVDGANKYLYAANEGSFYTMTSTISGFALNSSTGALTPVASSPFVSGFEPVKIAITPIAAPAAPPAQVPEGDTLVLVGTGLASLAGYAGLRWRARRAKR